MKKLLLFSLLLGGCYRPGDCIILDSPPQEMNYLQRIVDVGIYWYETELRSTHSDTKWIPQFYTNKLIAAIFYIKTECPND